MGDGFLDDVGDSHKMDMANGPAAPPLMRASTSSKTPEEFREYYAATKLQARYRGRQGRQGTQTNLHAARKAAERRYERPTEMMDLFIVPDVALVLKTTYPDDPTKAGEFTVTGPPATLRKLQQISSGSSSRSLLEYATHAASPRKSATARRGSTTYNAGDPITGVISPKSEVTLSPEVKKDCGIPDAATHFAFVYPLRHLKRNLGAINLAKDQWGFAVIVGAFGYFDEQGTLLAVNALSIVPSPTVLHLVGPYAARQQPALQMTRMGRMSDITIDGLLDAGFRRFGWLHPEEQPGGAPLSEQHPNCPHGGFLYEMADGGIALFVLTGAVDPDRDQFDHDGSLGHAFIGLRQTLVEMVDAAGESVRDLGIQFLKQCFWLFLSLALTVGIACAVLIPSKGTNGSDREDWSVLDVIYFTVVTVSTVGYGDYTVDEPYLMVFNVLLILTGIVLITRRLTATIVIITHPLEDYAVHHLNKLFPTITTRDPLTGLVVMPNAYVYYGKNLLPELLLNMAVQSLSALAFVLLDERMDFGTAVYHCIVTATTVGYGCDYRYGEVPHPGSTPESKVLMICHILLSISLVGNAIAFIDKLRTERSKELKRVEALNRKLTLPLLESLELRAATLRPDVQRDAEGLTELEFVICMAVELGMVDMKQLQPFIDQFRALDLLGNGRLGMRDLRQMQTMQRQLQRATSNHDIDGDGKDRLMLLTQFLQAREENKLEQHRGKGQKKQGSGSPNGAAKTLKERLSRENTLSEHSLKGGSKWRAIQRESSQSLAKAGSNPWSVQAAAAPEASSGTKEGRSWGLTKWFSAKRISAVRIMPNQKTRREPVPVLVGGRHPDWTGGSAVQTPRIVARMQVLSNAAAANRSRVMMMESRGEDKGQGLGATTFEAGQTELTESTPVEDIVE